MKGEEANHSRRIRLGWVFLFSFAVLLPSELFCVVSNEWFTRPPKPVGDGPDYENIAFHLASGEGFRFNSIDPQWRSIYELQPRLYQSQLTAAPRDLAATGRPPLYPLLIALVYLVADRGPLGFAMVRCLSATCLALAGALACTVTARFFLDGNGSSRAGAKASQPWHSLSWAVGVFSTLVLVLMNRTLHSYALDFLTEPLALMLTQLLLATALLWPTTASGKLATKKWALAGAIVGLMILTRSIFLVWLPGICMLVAFSQGGSAMRKLQSAALLAATAVCVCLPWWIHNVVVLQRWMPLGTQGAITMLGGYSDEALAAGGDWQFAPEQRLRATLRDQARLRNAANDTQREVIISEIAAAQLRGWITEHWTELGSMFASRIVTHWNPYWGLSLVWKLAAMCGGVVLLYAAMRYGAGYDAMAFWLIGMPLLSTLVAAALYTTGGRFLVPMYGILSTLGGLGLAALSAGFLSCVGLAKAPTDRLEKSSVSSANSQVGK